MTKTEIRNALCRGGKLEDILNLSAGQECEIYKDSFFAADDEVIYIPDTTLNSIPTYRPVTDEECRHILSYCYTRKDFLEEAGGDVPLAYRLFCYVDWQNPCSSLIEVDYEDEADRKDAADVYAAALRHFGKECCA